MLRCRQQLDKHGQPWLAEGHCGDSRLRENLLKEKSKRESASQQSRERTRLWERERRRGRGFTTKGSHDGGSGERAAQGLAALQSARPHHRLSNITVRDNRVPGVERGQ